MDEGLVALAVGEPSASDLMPGSQLVRLDGCEMWRLLTSQSGGGAAVGGRVEDVSLRGSWGCGRPA